MNNSTNVQTGKEVSLLTYGLLFSAQAALLCLAYARCYRNHRTSTPNARTRRDTEDQTLFLDYPPFGVTTPRYVPRS